MQHVETQWPWPNLYTIDSISEQTTFLETFKTIEHQQEVSSILWYPTEDLFHENNPLEDIDKVLAIICSFPQHNHIILTKQPRQMVSYFNWTIDNRGHAIEQAALEMNLSVHFPDESMDNVWLGVSVENQEQADERIPLLLDTQGYYHRFISVEPMLESIDLYRYFWLSASNTAGPYKDYRGKTVLYGTGYGGQTMSIMPSRYIDIVICGGEQGPNARFMDPDWARNLRDQCIEAKVPFYMKQMSGEQQIPEDLMVRDMVVSAPDPQILCPFCNGEGFIEIEERVTRDMALDAECPESEGDRYFVKAKCPKCKGDGWIYKSEQEENF